MDLETGRMSILSHALSLSSLWVPEEIEFAEGVYDATTLVSLSSSLHNLLNLKCRKTGVRVLDRGECV